MQNVLSIEITNRFHFKADRLMDVILILFGTLFIAICSRVAIYLPFSPVPVTGQTFAVLLMGTILGCKRGGICMGLYVLEGVAGLPVFAAGTSGIGVLFGPTFGYLAGFILAGAFVGWLAEKGFDRRRGSMVLAFCTGQAIIYFFGILRLSSFVGTNNVFALGIAPFLLGDVLKAGMAMILLPSAWKIMSAINDRR